MDLTVFEDRYRNDETGRLAYDPKILLKVVLLGYARGLVGSRKMEQACREENLDAYIPDKKFRTRDSRFATQERWKSGRRKKFGLEDFRYQKETDEYICPKGKVLHRIAKN